MTRLQQLLFIVLMLAQDQAPLIKHERIDASTLEFGEWLKNEVKIPSDSCEPEIFAKLM